MNADIEKLYAISKKNVRKIIGLMSGTSLDGLDVALCGFTGSGLNTKIKLLHFETVSFDVDFKAEIKNVFSKKQVDLEKLTLLNPYIGLRHAAIINDLLKQWNIKNISILNQSLEKKNFTKILINWRNLTINKFMFKMS